MDPRTNSVAYQRPSRRPKAYRGRVLYGGRVLGSLTPPLGVFPPLCATFGGRVPVRAPVPSPAEDIPHSPDRVQQLLLEPLVDLLPQTADQHVDDVRLRIEVVVPHVRQDHRLRYDLAGVPHQILEQRELARPQLDRRAAAR